MSRVIEIRSYNLKPGARPEFHRRVLDQAMPLMERFQVDVVAFGTSPHDETSYYLIRAYDDLAHREASQAALYGSADWREGPRDAILALIDTYTSVILELEDAAIDSLRARPALRKG